jgi:N4-gp56 family major capsid protein
MGTQGSGGTASGRLNKMKAAIIAHAMHAECLAVACDQKDMPKNNSDTAVFRSWVPYGATAANPNVFNVTAASHIVQEGVTPAPDTIVPRDVTIVLYQYAALYGLTDKDEELYEDNIPEAMTEAVGERMGLVKELIIYGVMKAATARFYGGGSSITTRQAVNNTVTDNVMANVARFLRAQHAKMIHSMLPATSDYATTPVEPAFVCYVHTDAEFDIRRLTGFKHKAEYATYKPISDYELGTSGQFRFVIDPELASYPNAGAAVGSTGMYSSGGVSIDVYPMIVLAKDAVGCLKLRGKDGWEETYIRPGQKDSYDPLGQKGYIGAKFYMGAAIQNPGWVTVVECGITAL